MTVNLMLKSPYSTESYLCVIANGKGQQFTYDHIWDVSGVGSGVYTFVVTATKSGERDIHKTGRVGVVK